MKSLAALFSLVAPAALIAYYFNPNTSFIYLVWLAMVLRLAFVGGALSFFAYAEFTFSAEELCFLAKDWVDYRKSALFALKLISGAAVFIDLVYLHYFLLATAQLTAIFLSVLGANYTANSAKAARQYFKNRRNPSDGNSLISR